MNFFVPVSGYLEVKKKNSIPSFIFKLSIIQQSAPSFTHFSCCMWGLCCCLHYLSCISIASFLYCFTLLQPTRDLFFLELTRMPRGLWFSQQSLQWVLSFLSTLLHSLYDLSSTCRLLLPWRLHAFHLVHWSAVGHFRLFRILLHFAFT